MRNKLYGKLQQCKEQYPFLFASPIMVDDFKVIEAYAGWRMPEQYAEFLKFSSGAIVGAYPIFGTEGIELMGGRCAVL